MKSATVNEPSAEVEEQGSVPPEREDRKKAIVTLVGMLAFPFLIVTMIYATYVGTMHAPQVKDLPVAVVDSVSAPAGGADLTAALEAVPDDQIAPRSVAGLEEATALLERQEVAAVVVPPTAQGQAAQVYIASAAGASKAQTVQQLVLPVTAGLGWSAEVQETAALPEGDSSGTVVLFAALAMMLSGYVPISIMMMGTPHLLRVRRFLPVLAVWAVSVSTVIWLLLGPLLGGVEGHYLTFLGVGSLTIAAVGLFQLFFAKLAGPVSVLIGMLLLVVFGMTSSNLALPIESMPAFFGFLHHILPLPAAGGALRSAIYFDGAGLTPHLITLVVGLVVGLVLSILVDRKKGDVIPAASKFTDANTPLPALPGGPIRSKRTRYIAAAAFPGSMIILVAGLMGFSMNAPTLSDMPVAVVGASTQIAEQAAAELQSGLGDLVDLQVMSSVQEADAAITSQDVVAAYVLPSADGQGPVLHTASGAGKAQQSAVSAIFTQIAAAQGGTLETDDVAPLSEHDTQGSTSLYLGMAWVMAGFLICAVMRGGAPTLRTVREQLPILAGWAIGMSVWLWFLFAVLIGAIEGNAAALIGIGVLTIFSTSMAASVLTRTVGMAAVPVVVVALILAGVPASGGGMSIYMVPELFRTLHDVLPLPAAVNIVRSLTYLDGTGVGGSLLVIAVWGAVALAINLVIDRWLVRRPINEAPERFM